MFAVLLNKYHPSSKTSALMRNYLIFAQNASTCQVMKNFDTGSACDYWVRLQPLQRRELLGLLLAKKMQL